MTFERPWWLLLLPIVALWTWYGARSWRGEASPTRRALVIVAEAVTLASLVLAAAGARWVRRAERLAVVLVIDRSRSTDLVPGVESLLRRLLDEAPSSMRAGDLLGVVSFARAADTTLVPSPRPRTRGAVAIAAPPSPREGTDIAGAIVHALGDVPPDTNGRLVLVSDGDETEGDALSGALLASASGVPVDVVVLERPERRDVSAVRLRAPDRVQPGEPVDLATVVHATRAGNGRVELIRDGQRVGRADVSWGAGEDLLHLRDEGLTPGLHRYEVRVVPSDPSDDEVVGNEVAAGYVRVTGGSRAVVVDGHRDSGGGEAMASALRSAGMEVDLVGPTSAPATSGEWGQYDLVVLSDVRARELDPGALPVLREQVRELGAGLWMAGSDGSFGPGGYGHTPVEDVLPVTLDLRQHRMHASVALAIVIDKSGSMGMTARDGRAKIELANEGAARSAAMLSPFDQVAIAHVDTEVEWTYPMHAADDPAAVARAAHRGTAGGGGIATDVGLRAAYEVLGGTHATIRHVILLADGDDAEDAGACPPLVSSARARRITTSVVAIGHGHDEAILSRLASLGEGRYYITDDARSLPQIFTEETVIAARAAVREEPFRPHFVRGAEVLRGVDPSGVPTVQGYVVTEARPRAEVLAEALEHDPWLARWQIGVGRGAALTSDVDGRWTLALLAWPGAPAMMAQTGLWLARGVHDAGVRVTAVPARGKVRVEVDATTSTGRWDTGLDLEARVMGPGGESTRVPLEARGPGRYEAEVDTARAGGYLVTVTSAGTGVVGVTGAEVTASSEVTARRGNGALLAEVAARTGGRVRTSLAGVFAGRALPKRTSWPLARGLTWLALVALVVGVAFRRLPGVSFAALRGARGRESAEEPARENAGAHALTAMRAFRAAREAREGAAIPKIEAKESPAVPETPREEPTSLDELVARKRERRRK